MKKHILPIAGFVLITILFTFPIYSQLNTAIYGPLYGSDSRGTIWQLWWSSYAYKHNLDYSFHSIVAAPYGSDASGLPTGFLWELITRWLPILTNEIFAYNFVLILSFILACLFIYFIAFLITKNIFASFVSGIIFGFCPYHFQRAWGHFSLAQIQWPALYFLSLLMLYEKFSWKNTIIFIVSFSLVLHMEFNYTYIMGVLTFLFFIFILIDNQKQYLIGRSRDLKLFFKNLGSRLKLIGKFISVGFLAAIVNFSLIWSIIRAAFIAPRLSSVPVDMGQRPFHYLFSQSARLLSYFVPSGANPVLGGAARALEGSFLYGRGAIEHTLYLGWIPILLTWIIWKQRLKISKGDGLSSPDKSFYIRLLLFIAIGGFLFSMPPYINLGIFKIYFPSFFMHKILPMFRAYARFGLLSIMSVSLLAGIGLQYLLEKTRGKTLKFVLGGFVICLILFEFNNIPPYRITDVSQPPAVYAWLAKQESDIIIAEYPLGEPSKGETYIELDYLFYQRIHQKRIINGAKPGTKASLIKQGIFKIADSKTPQILSSLGVKYVILHLDRYREGTNKKAVEIIGDVPNLSRAKGLKLVKKFGVTEIYEVVSEPINLDKEIFKDNAK